MKPSAPPTAICTTIVFAEKLVTAGTLWLRVHMALAITAHHSQRTAPYIRDGICVTDWHSLAVASASPVAIPKRTTWPPRRKRPARLEGPGKDILDSDGGASASVATTELRISITSCKYLSVSFAYPRIMQGRRRIVQGNGRR